MFKISVNTNAITEFLKFVGVYPVSKELPLTSLMKGIFIIYGFLMFALINLWVELHIWVFISWVVPQDLIDLYRDAVKKLFWNICIYLIDKRKIKIVISGVNLKDKKSLLLSSQFDELKNALVLSNHRSLFDFFLIYYLKNLIQGVVKENINLSFFHWCSIWQVPLNWRLFYSIFFSNKDENWEFGAAKIDDFFNSIQKSDQNNWIVHFPEMSLFTEENRLEQQLHADRNYLPQLDEVLYPRFGNFDDLIPSIIKANKKATVPITSIIDLSIIYYNPILNEVSSPTLFELFTLKQPLVIIYVDFKIKPINKLPVKQRKLEKWLEYNWCEKNKIIEAIRKEIQVDE